MLLSLALLALATQCLALSSTATLTVADKARLQEVLEPGWKLSDLNAVMFAASGYKHLGAKIPDAKATCSFVNKQMTSSANTETIFTAASAAQYLGCPMAGTNEIKQILQSSLSESSAMVELYHSVLGLQKLGSKPDSAKVLPLVQSALKKDDSVLNLGYAFHIASVLSGDVSSVYDRIEDAVVQADEVDGKMLQFEGGLSITALVIDGAYRLCETAKRPVPLKPDQAVKFANYLVSRKSVQLPKGVHYLLHALTMFTTNPHHLPLSISLSSSVAVSASQPMVQITVTDLLGKAVSSGVKVVADSVTAKDGDGVKLLSNVNLTPVSGSKTLFEFDAMKSKLGRGFYDLSVTVTGSDKRLVGNSGAMLIFKILTSVSVDNVEIGTADADQSAAPKMKSVKYGTRLSGGAVEADRHQKVLMKFVVKDTSSGENTRVHQAFVRISSKDNTKEVIFVAEPDFDDVYKFDMSVSDNAKDFKSVSGLYSVELIIGDASISNPLKWNLADLSLNFPQTAEQTDKGDMTYQPKPAISHLFSVADKRPPAVLSTLFTGLCLAPLGLLLILWAKLGVNISNFPFSLTAIGFHLGLGGIFLLYCLFWLQLNMFATLRYLLMIGVVTFYCGNSMLSRIASGRKDSK